MPFSTCLALGRAAAELSRLLDDRDGRLSALFLMFAESRGLVPNWHPLYRGYHRDAARDGRASRRDTAYGNAAGDRAACAQGCRAGSLVVPPFNGRLFSPARSPIAESCRVDDDAARQALLAVSTTRPERASTIATSA
jgi:hypothetical protein